MLYFDSSCFLQWNSNHYLKFEESEPRRQGVARQFDSNSDCRRALALYRSYYKCYHAQKTYLRTRSRNLVQSNRDISTDNLKQNEISGYFTVLSLLAQEF